jgi:MFS family permease
LAAVVVLLVIGAAVAAAVRLADEGREPVASQALVRRLLAGVRYLRRDGDARAVVGLLALASAISGFAVTTASVIAVEVLHMGAGGAPLLIALGSLGGLGGALVMVRLIGSYPLAVLVAAGILLTATAAVAITVPSRLVAGFAFFGFGFGTAAQAVGCRTLLHRVVPPGELAGAVGVNGLLSVGAVGLGGLAASLLVVAVGVRSLLIGAGVVTSFIALLVLWRLRRVERAANRYQHELEVLQAVAVFAPMSLAAKIQLAAALDRHDIAAGADVVREGDPGQTLYVIERGRLGAYVGGRRVRTMAPGDHFGEIALLAATTRTATVRAEEDATIWSLSADQFLAALRGSTQAHAIAAAVVYERRGAAG